MQFFIKMLKGKTQMDYDKDPIIVVTPHTYSQMKKFQRFHHRKLRHIFFIVIAAIIAFTIYIIPPGTSVLALLLFLLDDFVLFILLLMPIIFLLFIGVSSFGVLYTKKKHAARMQNQKDGQTLYFRNRDYVVEIKHPDTTEKMTYSYDMCYRAYETKEMFYLYTGKNMAALVDKQGLLSSSPDELRSLLKENIPPEACKLK